MEVPSIVLAVIGALAGPTASIKVASIQANRALDDLTKRLGKMEDRIAHLEQTEPADAARLRDDLDALAKDVAAVRSAVDRLSVEHHKAMADDERRREKAAERAERREMREREQETALAAKLATVVAMIESLQKEIRDARPARR